MPISNVRLDPSLAVEPTGAFLHSLLDVAAGEDAVDEKDDGIAISLGELLQIAESIEEREIELKVLVLASVGRLAAEQDVHVDAERVAE
jgi:hypothetical protein